MASTRRLAAILAADIVGYSRLMGADEEGAHGAVTALRREVIAPAIDKNHGRIVKSTGDDFLSDFASVVDAVRCVVEMQAVVTVRNGALTSERRIEYRIGINIGEQAIARDPRYGPALASAAYCCYRLLLDGRSEDREVDRLKGAGFARQALEVAGDDPGVLVHAALALAWFGEDIGAMLALVDRALTLNPNYARGWQISGVLRSWAGEPDIAIEHVETALRLSPRARVGTSFLTIGLAHFVKGRFDAAVPKLLVAIQQDPGLPAPYYCLAACYAHMGRLDAAREVVTRLRVSGAILMESGSTLRNAEHRELLLSGLRLAAGEPE